MRLPYLMDIPRFTDESNEALKALVIAHGRSLPLTNIDPYIGPLWNYLLAAAFMTTGPTLETPRIVAALLGILTVIPTYLLACSLGGTAVGLLAAAFLALAPAHIVVNSHIAWSNCTTPFFTTLALWLTHRCVTRAVPSGLAVAAIVWGLALQTHPVAFLLLPGAAAYVLWAQPRWLRTVWPWIALALTVAACSPLLYANLRSGFHGIEAGMRVQEEYAAGEALTFASYGRRLGDTLSLLADSLRGALSEFGALHGPFADPMALVYLALVAMGLAISWRRREWLPVLTIVGYCALLPVINARFASVVPKARYVAPLFPLCFAAISLWIVEMYRRVDRLLLVGAHEHQFARKLARLGILVGVVSLWVSPLVELSAYYRDDLDRGRTNADLYALIGAVNRARRTNDQIYVDRALTQTMTPGGGRLYEHLQFAASVYGWNRVPVTLPVSPDDPLLRKPGLLVVASSNSALAQATMPLTAAEEGTDSLAPEGVRARVFRLSGPR